MKSLGQFRDNSVQEGFLISFDHFRENSIQQGIYFCEPVIAIITFYIEFRCVLLATALILFFMRGPIRKSFWTRKYCCKFAKMKKKTQKIKIQNFQWWRKWESKSLLRDNELPFKIRDNSVFAIIPYLLVRGSERMALLRYQFSVSQWVGTECCAVLCNNCNTVVFTEFKVGCFLKPAFLPPGLIRGYD